MRPHGGQVTTVPKSKLGAHIGRLEDGDVLRLNQAVLVFLGLATFPSVIRKSGRRFSLTTDAERVGAEIHARRYPTGKTVAPHALISPFCPAPSEKIFSFAEYSDYPILLPVPSQL
jgi:hypothetical protein